MISSVFLSMTLIVSAQAKPIAPNFAPEEEGCLAYSVLGDKAEIMSYGQNCKVRTAPCSTFKITAAELGFKKKKLNPKGESFKWDGVKRTREALNKDHDLLSWMNDSVVWVSSIVVNRLGRGVVQAELKNLDYGNGSTGPEEFWINGPLGISVDEQIKYLARQNQNLQDAMGLLPIEKIAGSSVMGKTGSCIHKGHDPHSQIGWYVGRIRSANQEYAFALRILKPKNSQLDVPASFRAKKLFLDWLPHLTESTF